MKNIGSLFATFKQDSTNVVRTAVSLVVLTTTLAQVGT